MVSKFADRGVSKWREKLHAPRLFREIVRLGRLVRVNFLARQEIDWIAEYGNGGQ